MAHKNGYTVVNGHVVFLPNSVLDGAGFFISYNDHDTAIYGHATTALVTGQMQKFFILNGDHRLAYLPQIDKGLDACINYFRENVAERNKFSDKADLPDAMGFEQTTLTDTPTPT